LSLLLLQLLFDDLTPLWSCLCWLLCDCCCCKWCAGQASYLLLFSFFFPPPC
jgi:hypothetical protein